MVISVAECMEQFLSAAPNFEDRFALWVRDPESNPIEDVFETIIRNGTLSREVTDCLSLFLDARPSSTAFAVRSSFNDSDAADSLFAGVFETYLNVRSHEAIVTKVLECFASCFKPEAIAFYARSRFRLPGMAVVIMEQLSSEVAGVLFQANPVTGSRSTCVISASYGQGDGVNGGIVAADEWWLDSKTVEVRKRVVGLKNQMVGLSEDHEKGGTVLLPVLPVEKQTQPCLSDELVKRVVRTARAVASVYTVPQDLEFAFVGQDLFILQTRPINRRSHHADWTPPDETKEWKLYTLTSLPMTPVYASVWSHAWSEGLMYNAHLMGNVTTSTEACVLNGFGFYSTQTKNLDPTASPLITRMQLRLRHWTERRNAAAFWKKKKYTRIVDEWDNVMKAQVIKKHLALAAKPLMQLRDVALLEHFDDCYENMSVMFNRHVIDQMQSMAPTAWFVTWVGQNAKAGTNVDENEAYIALEGHSPAAEGLHGEFPLVFTALATEPAYSEFVQIVERTVNEPEKCMEQLVEMSRGVGRSVAKMISIVEYRLVQGYDTVNPTLKEKQRTFVSIIKSEVAKTRDILAFQNKGVISNNNNNNNNSNGSSSINSANPPELIHAQNKVGAAAAQSIRNRIPTSLHSTFDALLAEARALNRLRDERALYTDLTAAGLLHHCMLEIGRRVFNTSKAMDSPMLILYGSYDEICTLLTSTDKDVVRSIVSDLKSRRAMRVNMSVRDAPCVIGARVTAEVTPKHFPTEYMWRTYMTTEMVLKQMVGRNTAEEQDQRVLSVDDDTIRGIAGSNGVHRGRVLLLQALEDFEAAEKGAVVVTPSTSSLINLVLPFAGAIVTDFGALLSHAAVCAREAGIPCVIGTKIATSTLRSGMLVEVDGNRGTVRVIEGNIKRKSMRVRNHTSLPAVMSVDSGAVVTGTEDEERLAPVKEAMLLESPLDLENGVPHDSVCVGVVGLAS